MARFYGSLQGNRGEATRCGSSALSGHVRGWNVGARVHVTADEDGEDVVTVTRTRGSRDSSGVRVLARFRADTPVGDETPDEAGGRDFARHVVGSPANVRAALLGLLAACERAHAAPGAEADARAAARTALGIGDGPARLPETSDALASLDRTLGSALAALATAASYIPKDGSEERDLRDAIDDVRRAADTVRGNVRHLIPRTA